ncbi:MAG: hypothetical protein Q4G36_07700, partial [Paracoccus sp. (in: a-proteobacteria)]|nr:hypothetical protein [Paracoccus sp. (in: a-proteobacteria)]
LRLRLSVSVTGRYPRAAPVRFGSGAALAIHRERPAGLSGASNRSVRVFQPRGLIKGKSSELLWASLVELADSLNMKGKRHDARRLALAAGDSPADYHYSVPAGCVLIASKQKRSAPNSGRD